MRGARNVYVHEGFVWVLDCVGVRYGEAKWIPQRSNCCHERKDFVPLAIYKLCISKSQTAHYFYHYSLLSDQCISLTNQKTWQHFMLAVPSLPHRYPSCHLWSTRFSAFHLKMSILLTDRLRCVITDCAVILSYSFCGRHI